MNGGKWGRAEGRIYSWKGEELRNRAEEGRIEGWKEGGKD